MHDNSENKSDTSADILDYFQSAADGVTSAAAPAYRKAVSSLKTFLKVRNIDFLPVSETTLADWIAFMYLSGISYKTSFLYLNSISGIYKNAVEDGAFQPTDSFKIIKAKLKEVGEESWQRGLKDNDFNRFVNLCRSASRLTGDSSIAVDLLLYTLLNGCRPIMETAMLRKEDAAGGDECDAIISRQSDARRKYLFDLRQSVLTPRQLSQRIQKIVIDLFKERNLPYFNTIDETLRSYWAYASLKYGLSAQMTVSFLDVAPSGIPALSLASKEEIPDRKRFAMTHAVGEMFVQNPLRWYAMRLRPRVKYDELDKRFVALKDELNRPDIFYPCEEIAKRTGKKLKFEKKPVISDIVFFRSRVTDIFPMFTKIGDIAWCYTTPSTNGRTYAAIPSAAFRQFQETIGQFTPEYEVANIGELQPDEDEKVVVIGGLFQGREADFKKIDKAADDNTIYRLQFLGDNGFEWRIGVDRRLLRKKREAEQPLRVKSQE